MVAVAVAVVALTIAHRGSDRPSGYDAMAIDARRAPAEVLLERALADARRWSPDATWLTIQMGPVRADGTVDLAAAGETPAVRLISPSRARSMSPRRRQGAVREYRFTRAGVRRREAAGIAARLPEELEAALGCRVSDLVRAARRRGLGRDEAMRLSYDLRLDRPGGAAWRVFSENRQVAGYYRATDCSYHPGT